MSSVLETPEAHTVFPKWA